MPGLPDPSKPEYVDAIIAFVDILGFRSMLVTRPAYDILKVLRLLECVADAEPGVIDPSVHVRIFSDSVIRIARRDEPGALFWELNTLRLAQIEMAAQGIFLRGGITFGKVYWDETIVFGPGVADAYQIESNFAVVPRIVVGPPVLHAILEGQILTHHELEQELAYLRTMISRAEDGVWFIDYLREADRDLDEPGMYCDLLERHKHAILAVSNTLDRTGRLSSLAMKMSWLARYHNDTVTAISDSYLAAMGYDRDSLSINVDELPTLIDLPEAVEEP